MTGRTYPPRWAEAILRRMLAPRDRETVSGDLLEEYREHVLPERGCRTADRWYIVQVGGFVWCSAGMWAVLFSASFVARNAFDWFVPPRSFYARSLITTWVAIGLFGGATFSNAWRARSIRAALVTAAAMTIVSAVLSTIGDGLILAIWHDPSILRAIDQSGGMDEVWLLPIFAIIPATIVGLQAGIAARVLAAIVDYARARSAASSAS